VSGEWDGLPNREPVPAEGPTGPLKHAWYSKGYQAAMVDVIREYRQGGEAALIEWVKNNTKWKR